MANKAGPSLLAAARLCQKACREFDNEGDTTQELLLIKHLNLTLLRYLVDASTVSNFVEPLPYSIGR